MNWIDKVKAFCDTYNIPYDYLAETLNEPKVIPMIRGKAFEFTALLALQNALPSDEFVVSKTPMNAQLGSHDIDVAVYHKPTDVTISIECKLGGKGTYRYSKANDQHSLRIKCMRSRTLGDARVEQQSFKLAINAPSLKVHNDSYIPADFDVVFASIGNVFYVTRDNGTFEWNPSAKELQFLQRFVELGDTSALQDKIFNTMFIAPSKGLAVLAENDNICLRRNCTSPHNCGFIPNYPYMYFTGESLTPNPPWYALADAAQVMRNVAKSKL
jgi:hypothetical protein